MLPAKNHLFGLLVLLLWPVLALADIPTYNVTAFGARGDGSTNDAPAIQQAINACSNSGGGRVLLTGGHTYMAGPLQLKSNVQLYITAGTTLLANPDESIYTLSAFGSNRGEGTLWLWAEHARNISITGGGTISGNGIKFMGAPNVDSYDLKPVTTFDPRPHVLTLIDVANLSITDINITEGAYWTIHLVGCTNAVISGVNLLNNVMIRNGDGIDIDHSKYVRISNCHITSGDDCICLKNRREYTQYGSCHDIVVDNCILTSRSCAIKIGSENVDSIYNASFSNCIVTNSNRGLGIQNRDEGTVTNISFSNIMMDLHLWSDVWWGKAEPIYVTSYPRPTANNKDGNWRFRPGQTVGECGRVSHIYFNNITATTENGCFIGADVPGKVEQVVFNNVSIELKRLTHYPTNLVDKRPCQGNELTTSLGKPVETENVVHCKLDIVPLL